jgi:hypothetical protein
VLGKVDAVVFADPGLDAGTSAPIDAAAGLGPADVRRVVMSHAGAVRACYELEAQKTPDLKGTMRVAWRIDPDGSARDVKIVESTLGSPRVEACVIRQVSHWRFPQAGKATVIDSFPFKFAVAP